MEKQGTVLLVDDESDLLESLEVALVPHFKEILQSDISVASFWITNPTNHLIGNHAAGGDFYGFWY